MKKKYIYVIVILLLIWLLWIGTILLIKIDLNGDKVIYMEPNTEYEEEGATAHFLGTRLRVTIDGTVNTHIGKTYSIYYAARNPLGIVRKIKRTVIVRDRNKPVLTLRGNKTVVLKQGNVYKEPGYQAIDPEEGDISHKVTVKKALNTNKIGLSSITYTVSDRSGNKAEVIRAIRVIPKVLTYLDEYDKLDNMSRGWGHGNKKDHKRPQADVTPEILKPYSAYYMGDDEKVIYLTLDEGSNDTYVKEIMGVLREKKVRATFFLCRKYMDDNKALIRQMVKDGHIVGNHTSHHKMMPTLANKTQYDTYRKEITDTADTFREITGKEMPKVYREPAGEWSYRSLRMVQDMGYRTYFWSAAYVDFEGDLSKTEALQKLMSLYHNGAIYLLHPKNKGNYLALADFIDNMRDMGYRFDTVDQIG